MKGMIVDASTAVNWMLTDELSAYGEFLSIPSRETV